MRGMTVVLMLAIVFGCATPMANGSFRDRDWTLVWIEGFDSMPAGVATPTIRFGSDGRLSGNTGCNRASAGYTAAGDRLTIDAIASTKRACLDPQGNALERAYLDAVEATTGYRIAHGGEGDELELADAAGKVVARFR